jgi:hypothetical protein
MFTEGLRVSRRDPSEFREGVDASIVERREASPKQSSCGKGVVRRSMAISNDGHAEGGACILGRGPPAMKEADQLKGAQVRQGHRERLGDELNIENGIVSNENAADEEVADEARHVRKYWSMANVPVGDTVDLPIANPSPGLDDGVEANFIMLWKNHCNLDDIVDLA